MAGWRTKLAGLLHEQLAPLYSAQEDQAQTLDRVRRSHEEVLGSQQEALHSLRQTQEVVEQLTQESARMSGELLSLVHEIYGPAGPGQGHSLVTALAAGQEVLLNSLAELAPPPVGPQVPAEPSAITVIIPTCDRPGGLGEALLSLRAQTRLPRRVAVVNDGSAPVDDVVERHRPHLPDVRLLHTPQAYSGDAVARNTALDSLTDDCVAYLDDDNLMWPTWLQTVHEVFSDPHGPDVVYGAQVRTDTASQAGLLFRRFDPDALRSDNFIDTGMIAHRATSIRWNPSVRHCSDWDFLLSLLSRHRIEAVPRIASVYRHDQAVRMSSAPGFRLIREAVRVHHRYDGPSHGCPVCRNDVAHWGVDEVCPVCASTPWDRAAALVAPYVMNALDGPVALEGAGDAVRAVIAAERAGEPVATLTAHGDGVPVRLPQELPDSLAARFGLATHDVVVVSNPGVDLSALATDCQRIRAYLQ